MRGHVVLLAFIGLVLMIVAMGSVSASQPNDPLALPLNPVVTEPDAFPGQREQFAVTLDTVVTLTAVADAYVNAGLPTNNYSNTLNLFVGRDEFLQEYFPLLRFDLSSIPSNVIVSSAQLELRRQGALIGPTTVPLTISRATAAWNEATVTWNTRPGLVCCFGKADVGTATAYYTWNVTSLVGGWLNGSITNHGLAVRGPTDIMFERSFDSRINNAPPRLVVRYSLPIASARTSPTSIGRGLTATITGTNFVPGNINLSLNGVSLGKASAPAGSFAVAVTVPISFTPGLATLTVCASAYCAGGAGPQNIQMTVRILPRLSDLPPGFVRRALDFLDSSRADTPEWASAFLDDVATPYYRPDVPGPAYYEFGVRAISSTLAAQAVSAEMDAGYLVLSTGEHDFPIAGWNSEGAPPSRDMQTRGQGQVVTMYKLAATHLAGEAGDGTLAASDDQNPMVKLVGLNQIDLNSLNGKVVYESLSDPNTTDSGQFVRTGVFANPVAGVTVTGWSSWQALKSGYTDAYTISLQVKRQHAADDWRYQHNLETFGVALLPGESYTLTILGHATIVMSGTGVSRVQTTTLPSALRITAISAVAGQSFPFDVRLDYGDGRTETVRFVVIDMVVRNRVFLPLVMTSGANVQSAEAPSAPKVVTSAQSPASPQDITHLRWVAYWAAGGRFGQRVWDQLNPYEGPNANECPSGCGGAAWAILFGWADYRASLGDPNWINQWGLYRQNGGVATANVAAPRHMRAAGDAGGALTAEGLGVANMLMEIRSEIHTFCFTSAGGATTPWDMDGAFRYADRRRYARIYASAEHNWFNNEWGHVWDQLRYRQTPSVIMTGSLGDGTLHYPVAFGARGELVRDCGWDWGVNWPWGGTRCEEKLRNTSFYINPGWGSSTHFTWVPASTGFYTVMEPR